jgi:hypothetical protein
VVAAVLAHAVAAVEDYAVAVAVVETVLGAMMVVLVEERLVASKIFAGLPYIPVAADVVVVVAAAAVVVVEAQDTDIEVLVVEHLEDGLVDAVEDHAGVVAWEVRCGDCRLRDWA